MNPSQRTIKYLRDAGWPNVQNVEVWIPQAKRRRDLFHFADIIAQHPLWGVLYVQATSGDNVSARLEKMREFSKWHVEHAVTERVEEYQTGRVEIHGWRKLKGRGQRKWFPRIVQVTVELLHNLDTAQFYDIYRHLRSISGDCQIIRLDGYTIYKNVVSVPARIEIEVCRNRIDGEYPALTSSERARLLDVARGVAERELEDRKLVFREGAPRREFDLMYYVNPENYREYWEKIT